MKVNVEYFLACRLAVCQEHVHPLAFDIASSQRNCNPVGYSKYMSACFFMQVGKKHGVLLGNDQHMPRVHRLDIHEGRYQFIFKHHAGGEISG